MSLNHFRQPREGWKHRQKTAVCFTKQLIRFYHSLDAEEKQSFNKLLRRLFKKVVWAYTEAWGPKYNANPLWSTEALASYQKRRNHSTDRQARTGLIFEHVVPKNELVDELMQYANTTKFSKNKIEKLFYTRALSAVITSTQHKKLTPHSTPNPWLRYKNNHVWISDHPGIPTRYRKSLRKLKLLR